jgi:hypothetical protein
MNGEFEELDIILPRETIDQLNARAAAKGCRAGELVYRALIQAREKGSAYLSELGETVKAIDAALDEGQKEPWPKSFNERLVVGLLLSELFTLSAENLLLELDGEKMDIVESICRQGGISYEEFTREVIDTFLRHSNDESGAHDDPPFDPDPLFATDKPTKASQPGSDQGTIPRHHPSPAIGLHRLLFGR